MSKSVSHYLPNINSNWVYLPFYISLNFAFRIVKIGLQFSSLVILCQLKIEGALAYILLRSLYHFFLSIWWNSLLMLSGPKFSFGEFLL